MSAVKRTRRRSSGTRHALLSQLNIGLLGRRRRRLLLPRPLLRRLRLAQELDLAARSFDLLARGRRDRVDPDGQLLRHLADPEQLHVGARVLDHALLDERRALLMLGRAADLAQPESPQRAAVALRLADLATRLRDLQLRHSSPPVPPSAASAPGAPARSSGLGSARRPRADGAA